MMFPSVFGENLFDGRGDEIQKVVTDKEMREAMYREYQL